MRDRHEFCSACLGTFMLSELDEDGRCERCQEEANYCRECKNYFHIDDFDDNIGKCKNCTTQSQLLETAAKLRTVSDLLIRAHNKINDVRCELTTDLRTSMKVQYELIIEQASELIEQTYDEFGDVYTNTPPTCVISKYWDAPTDDLFKTLGKAFDPAGTMDALNQISIRHE